MLRKLLSEERPDGLAVAFDLPKPTFRHLRYEGYKGHRKPMPEPLVDQLPWIKKVLKGFRVPIFELEGYEADDILGTLALRAARQGLEVFLVTGDKDALQLVGERVKVYRPLKEGHELLDERALAERWKLKPAQVVEVMALMGDEVDAIPGVPGIGEKTAVELIQKFGSVEKLVKALEGGEPSGVRPSVAEAIRAHTDQLQMSRELAALDTEVPLEVDLEQLQVREPDRAELTRLFQALEFRTLVKEFMPEAGPSSLEMRVWDSPEELARVWPRIRKADRVAVARVPGALGLAWEEGKAVALREPVALKELRQLWGDEQVTRVCPNLKELQARLYKEGIELRGHLSDPCLASYLLNPGKPSHRVEDLALERLGRPIAEEDPARAAAAQAEASLQLAPALEQEIREKELALLLTEVELPLSRVLARMEQHGMAIDPEAFEKLGRQIGERLTELTREIQREAGGEFNLNSPKQLSQVLFERLRMPVIKRTKTGASTDEEVLRRLALLHELPRKILEYRELAKLSSTYVEAIPSMADPSDGRVHCSFNQTVTATGRLSSSGPNLQNIPIRTELGRQIRRGFVPSERDGLLLAADYSQIELRILAHLSEDEALVEAFRQGQDIHRVTAAEIFHVEPQQVTPDQRGVAKTINFGILYGMSAFGLARELEVDQAEAGRFIDRTFARYPRVREYLARSLEETHRRGYCVTLFNRRRYLPELSAKEPSVRQFAERMAVNAPIQGSAADLIKVAMVAIDRALQEKGFRARMVCQVHDELIFDLPAAELKPVQALVKELMESPTLAGKPVRLRVPIQVNLKSGPNWYDASHD